MRLLTLITLSTTLFSNMAFSQDMKKVETKLPSIKCMVDATFYKLNYIVEDVSQKSVTPKDYKNIYEAAMNDEILSSGTGKALLIVLANGKGEQQSDVVKRITLQRYDLDLLPYQVENFQKKIIKMGATPQMMNSLKLIRSYNFSSLDVPLYEGLTESGKVLFRFVSLGEANSMNFFACK